jgi:hypothetical protein
MTKQAMAAGKSKPGRSTEQKVRKLQDAFADAPEIAKTALQNLIRDLTPQESAPRAQMVSAGRTGSRLGGVSELTLMLTLAPGGAERLRSLLEVQNGNFAGADMVGTVHDMRFVFLDDDMKLIFATAYDGEWDPYIDDFATKIPDYMDVAFSAFEGWPGIRSPKVKDWIAKHQITAEGWYVANPNLSVVETRRLEKMGSAVEEFLDKVG